VMICAPVIVPVLDDFGHPHAFFVHCRFCSNVCDVMRCDATGC
jgi:hypothetical protein